MIRSWFTESMIVEIKAYKVANTMMETDIVALRAQAVASAAETEAAATEVAARTTELALRVLQSPKLKADAERFLPLALLDVLPGVLAPLSRRAPWTARCP